MLDVTADDVRRIRKKYGLTQQSFARLLGLGDASVARYEGGKKPSKANANLIRAAANPRFMLDCLMRDGDSLSPSQREKTEKIVYAMISFDEDGEVMDINEIYEITLRQEILSEQAAQLMGEIMNLSIDARDRGDEVAEIVYEDILKQLARLKPTIVTEENSSMKALAVIKGKIDCMTDLVRMQRARAA